MNEKERRPALFSRKQIFLRSAAGVGLVVAAFFIPAGSFLWPQAWIFLFLYLSAVAAFFIQTKKRDPDLLRERISPHKNIKAWDRRIIRLYSFMLVVMIVLAGLDAVRFRWSGMSMGLNLAGFAGLVPASWLAFRAIRENTFASSVVRIQTDRGHRVCSTGPYARVRHPMYAGIILLIGFLPLVLGSFFALIPAGIIIGLFVLRTSLEDKALQDELAGYREYAQKVRFRLIPGVW